MQSSGVKTGVHVLTTMLKGYCAQVPRTHFNLLPRNGGCQGDMHAATELLAKMEKGIPRTPKDARPNIRTANTFLRGCLWSGSVNAAASLVTPTHEYLHTIGPSLERHLT